jgi:hypothetical protein
LYGAVEAKVELDASRLKTALVSFLFLKRRYPNVVFPSLHVRRNLPLLLELTAPWIDGIYQFSLHKDETSAFVKSIQEAVKQSYT